MNSYHPPCQSTTDSPLIRGKRESTDYVSSPSQRWGWGVLSSLCRLGRVIELFHWIYKYKKQ